MKQIINLKQTEQLKLNEIENKLKNARNSCDYILVNFAKGRFIKIAFCKDQTYCVGYNFYHMEFSYKTNCMLKQYPHTNNGKLSGWLTEWVNRFNK